MFRTKELTNGAHRWEQERATLAGRYLFLLRFEKLVWIGGRGRDVPSKIPVVEVIQERASTDIRVGLYTVGPSVEAGGRCRSPFSAKIYRATSLPLHPRWNKASG